MTKRNKQYWKNRAAQRMWEYMQSAEETADEAAKFYQKAAAYLNQEIDGIFEKYMTKHNLSEREAYELLSQMMDRASIQELLQKLQHGAKDTEKEQLIQKLEAPAYRARIERLEQIQSQLDRIMRNVYQQELALSTSHYAALAEEAYYKSVFDVQQRAGYGFSFAKVDQKMIDRLLKSKWSGKNYSTRIWNNTGALAQTLKEELLVSLVTGRTERETAEIIMQKFAQGSSQARRLIRTESSYITGQIDLQSYEECGIEKYVYLATLDLRTCQEDCAPLDGKIFPVKDAKSGVNMPPMHPWCRCTTISYFSDEILRNLRRRARDPVTGKTYTVPGDMTYQQWYREYVSSKNGTYEKGISNKRISKQDEYKIDRNAIESNKYKRKFSGITGNSIVDEGIYKYAKAGLIHRDGTNREDLYILSASKGTVLGKNVTSDEAFGVKPNESIRSAVINNQGDLIGLHTHPDGTPPTGSDFETAFKRGYHFGIVACSNGSVYTYGCADQFASARIIDDTIEKFKKMIDDSGKKVYPNDREAHLAAIKSLGKDYGIWYETR